MGSQKMTVTNRTRIKAKYGDAATRIIESQLRQLASKDAERGILTRIVYIDSATTMRRMGGRPVRDASNMAQNKAAIDAVAKKLNPDYLLIVGAGDVIPQQRLKNPAYAPRGDDDEFVASDLPYACDAPYSQDPAKFVGPTRVVGRLPDLVGSSDPSYLIALIEAAANYQTRTRDDYLKYFGLSAVVWRGSTALSLKTLFGTSDKMLLAPPSGPRYPGGQLKARTHFINCHGASASPEFYGQRGNSYPVSLNTNATLRQITKGTVAAVECCYGAELYNSIKLGIDMPICQSYLEQGAYGFWGSTTIAYGPADGNAQADLICQYFIKNVLDGASLGRAALMARQQFAQNTAQMDPMDLKTLTQYCLYGDPSIHPVAAKGLTTIPKSVSEVAAESYFRAERRAAMKATGTYLADTKQTASKPIKGHRPSAGIKKTLSGLARKAGLRAASPFTAFAVKGKAAGIGGARGAKAVASPTRYYLTIGTPNERAKDKIKLGIAVIAKEVDGQIVGSRVYYQR